MNGEWGRECTSCVHKTFIIVEEIPSLGQEAFVKLNSIYEWKWWPSAASKPSNWPVFHSPSIVRAAFLESTFTIGLCGNFVISFLYISFDIFLRRPQKVENIQEFGDNRHPCCELNAVYYRTRINNNYSLAPQQIQTRLDKIQMRLKFTGISILMSSTSSAFVCWFSIGSAFNINCFTFYILSP